MHRDASISHKRNEVVCPKRGWDKRLLVLAETGAVSRPWFGFADSEQ